METFQLILILQLFLVTVIKGQCFGNGTCVCHCVDCSVKCTTCLPGWSGSKDHNCQRRNTLYKAAAGDDKDHKNKLLDEDLSTFLVDTNTRPFLRVQLEKSISFHKVDITLLFERGVMYTVYIKERAYTRTTDVTCNTIEQSDNIGKRTVSITCYKPLTGKYIEIVSSKSTSVTVFEIQHFECTNGTFGDNCNSTCVSDCGVDCNFDAAECVCQKGFFGKFCNQTCSQLCDDSGCNFRTGQCLGCKNGYFGPLCEKNCSVGCQEPCEQVFGDCTCKPGFFGVNCSKQCPLNCLNKECEKSKGKCLACKDGYYGELCKSTCTGKCEKGCERSTGICDTCTKGFYSHFCNTSCSENCQENKCSRDGDCYQCIPGYKGDRCNERCPDHCKQCKQDDYGCSHCENGWFGTTCSAKCPAVCGGNGSCEIKSGKCHVCAVRNYGRQCKQKCSTYCDSDAGCEIDTGACVRCIVGRHGSHCENQCSQNCLNSTCLSNQTCSHGCKDGWFGDECNQECSAAFGSCSQCSLINSEPVCHKCLDSWFLKGSRCVTCPENCSSCKSETNCTRCIYDISYGKTCDIPCSGDCISGTCDMTGNCLHGCNNSKYGIGCDKDCAEGCSLCYDDFSCSICEDGWVGPPCRQCPDQCEECFDNLTCITCKAAWINLNVNCTVEDHCIRNSALCKREYRLGDSIAALYIGICVGLLVFVVVSIRVSVEIYRNIRLKRKRKEGLDLSRVVEFEEYYGLSVYNARGSQALLTVLDPEEEIDDAPVPNTQNHNYLNVKMSRISVKNLWEFKLQNQANEYMTEEFQDLPNGLLLECREAKKSRNKKRNRYKYVYPYDTTRVELSVEADGSHSDYINACYVNGHEKPREYIAAQAPFTDDTIVDFWRMIWQSNVNTIVILTNLEENNIMKCKQYWPTNEDKYGDFLVSKLQKESSGFCTVRCFKISREKEERIVEQFHFTAWPDKGVPSNVNSILEFREKVLNKADQTGPILVHCSAGIGRTGTFIGLDYLIKQGQRDGSVDVVSCVSRMRHQRAYAIQTVEQYIYLYDVITKALTGHQSSLLIDEFRPYFKNAKSVNPSTGNRNIVEDFQLIEKLTPEFDERRYQASKALHNKQKNRHNNILADDKYRICLSWGETDYINAIQLSDARGRSGYILTQTPLPNTVGDFLSLVAEQEVFCIVKLDHEVDGTVGVYSPTRDRPILSEKFDLFLLDKYEFGEIEMSSLQFHEKKDGSLRSLQLFHGHFWKENQLVPENHQPMIDLIETVLNCRKERNGHPVVVHCMNGAHRSGLFCVLANIVEQIQLFGSVDIMQTVLNTRHRRSQIVPCVEHLEYIFDFVETYLENAAK